MKKWLFLFTLFLPFSLLAQDDNVGVGIEIEQDAMSGQVMITKVLEGSTAEKAGLIANDEILSVDEQAVEELELDELIGIIKGKPGTKVWFWILRGDEEVYIPVIRQ